MKQILIVVLVVVGIIVGASVFSGGDEPSSGSLSNNFYGAESGVVTLTEYGDFQCPACAGFFPILQQVKEQFKDQLRFEFRHFPLVQIHPNATAAHRAAQAAANQGKFWEMHDLLYQRQQSWNTSTSPGAVFEQYAQELNLDMERFRSDVASSETLATINADVEQGKSLNVSSTPTFYLDGEQIEDLTAISTADGLTQLIQEAIDAKTGQDNSEDVTEPTEEQATEPEEVTEE